MRSHQLFVLVSLYLLILLSCTSMVSSSFFGEEEEVDEKPGKKTTDKNTKNTSSSRANNSSSTRQVSSTKDREKEGRAAARQTLRLGSSESCEWNVSPMAIVKGRLCGAYYKVLGLDRSLGKLDKQGLKKAYRTRSLQLHPDRNSSPEASAAFKIVQEAYECLTDERCLNEYEDRLRHEEYGIAERRYLFKEKIIDHTMNALTQVHYVISLASSHIYALGLDIWEMAGEFEMELFGMSHKIGQYALMACLVLSKARIFLQVHGIAYLISKLNYELAKSRGMF